MIDTTSFDEKLRHSQLLGKQYIKDGLIDVNDTLDFAWTSARSIFGKDATPEHALKICELMLDRIDHHHEIYQKEEDEIE